ncbi:SatD family protein [Winogradskyella jejuensis]|uniref:SatD family (SatD) n=1 Tax=Winogradskyella jejuensis TaxID=1089305 RepID=A0A1M5SYL4_9FLAO|nr:SatD family protein [Winogradskyella jejuensis]SHH43574.1 SatD family (SatD) [Winogradskyella jejuensis]
MTSVITGDIINSRSVINQDVWLKPLKEALQYISEGDNSKYEIYRGDSFQIEIEDITYTFIKAMYIKACIKSIKGFDVRLAVGVGDKTHRAHNVSESNGSAFLNSGSLLDFMKRNKINLRIKSDLITPVDLLSQTKTSKIGSLLYDFDRIFNLYFRFASVIMDNWTVNSAETVKLLIAPNVLDSKLERPKQVSIAEKINLNQEAVSKRLKRANIDELLELQDVYENHTRNLLDILDKKSTQS